MNGMKKNKNVKSVSARKLLTVTMLMFYHEHKLSLIVTLVICFSILYIKKIDLDCSLLRNDIVATRGEADIKRKALKLLYIELVGSFLQEFKQYIFANVFGKQIRLVSMKSYKYLLSEKKADKNDGVVQNNINIGNEAMAKLLSVIILNILPCIIGIYFLISKFNAEFKSLFAIAMIGSYFLCAYFHYKIINLKLHHKSKVNQSLGLGNRAIHATILNYESIKTNNMEDIEIKKYEQILREYEMSITKYKKYSNILTFIHRAIFSALKYTSYVYYIKNDDVKSFAKISILKTLIENSERNATNLGKIYMKYRNHAICSSLVYPYIKKKPIKFNRYAISDEELKIEFVNYRIEQTNRTVISDFNLTIPCGSKIAIMGKNGSGKSTLVKSILGLNDYEGHIYVNEHNHKHLEIASIRDKIGYVSQNITLFNDSVLYNILYGSKNKSASDAKRIAADINLHDNIKVLEHGYHTTLDEANNTLSGGERQKIIIARALVKDPAILIMDEPFSNLDVQSSETIFEYIFTKMADKTVIMVLHDSKYLSKFDKVITIN